MIKLKDLLLEAPQIKKVKNVSVQYMDAEYQGETLHGFKYFKKGPWLYKKDNGEYFAVVITNKNNRYEIQLGNKPKNNIQATAAVEKIIKKNLNKFESVNEGKVTYKFKGFTNKDMDELDAMLYRAGVRGTPDFNKRTYTVNLKGSNTFTLDKIMKGKGGKKIKESVNENSNKAVKDMISKRYVKKGQRHKDRMKGIGKWLDERAPKISAKYNDNWIRRIKMGRGGQVQDWWGDTMTMIKRMLRESINEEKYVVYVDKDGKGIRGRKIVKSGLSQMGAKRLYNKLVKTDDYQEVGYDDHKSWNQMNIKKLAEKKGDFLDSLFPKSKVDKAIKIAKKMGGNMTGAVKAIEKFFPGMSKHTKVQDALRKYNESVNEDVYYGYYKDKEIKVNAKSDNDAKKQIVSKLKVPMTQWDRVSMINHTKNKKNRHKFESINERMDKRQAAVTLKQLGGNKFIAMTGAKNFGFGANGLSFKIGRNAKAVNYVVIDLNGKDLYDIKFQKGTRVLKQVNDVYADQLQKIFTKHTGMYTSL